MTQRKEEYILQSIGLILILATTWSLSIAKNDFPNTKLGLSLGVFQEHIEKKSLRQNAIILKPRMVKNGRSHSYQFKISMPESDYLA